MAILYYEEAYEAILNRFRDIETKTLTKPEKIDEADKLYGEILALCGHFEEEYAVMELAESDKILYAKLVGLLNQVLSFSMTAKGHEIHPRSCKKKNPYQEIKKIDDPKDLNIKERIPLKAIKNLYATEEMVRKVDELLQHGYRELLQVKKDGNSFYRAVYIQLLAEALNHEPLLEHLIDQIVTLDTNDSRINIDRVEILDILRDAKKTKLYLGGVNPFEHFATNNEFDLAMVRLLKKMAALYLKENLNKPVLEGLTPVKVLDSLGYSIDSYMAELETMGTEAELSALDLLPLALNIRIDIADFSGNNLAVIEHGSGKLVAHLLFRPGRYDILY